MTEADKHVRCAMCFFTECPTYKIFLVGEMSGLGTNVQYSINADISLIEHIDFMNHLLNGTLLHSLFNLHGTLQKQRKTYVT